MINVIIPIHNHKTAVYFLSRLHQLLPAEVCVSVVDAAATDDTSDEIRMRFPWVHLLSGGRSRGWSESVNQGVRYTLAKSATAVLVMSEEVLVEQTFFPAMLRHHTQLPHTILGAVEIDADTLEIANGGEHLSWWSGRRTPVRGAPTWLTGLAPVTHLNALGLLIPTEVFRTIGLFDEKSLTDYYSDYDFIHRAIRAGYQVYCNHDAPLLVHSQISAARQDSPLKESWRHLFSSGGRGSLKAFTIYSVKNCPLPCLPTFLAMGYLRSFFDHQCREYSLSRPKPQLG